MSDVEYIMIGVTIVLAASFLRILEAIYWMAANAESRFDLLTFAWLVNRFIAGIFVFWAYKPGTINSREAYAFVDFLILFIGPVFLYLQSLALASRHPEKVIDWRARFENVRISFFATCTLMALCNYLATVALDRGLIVGSAYLGTGFMFFLGMVFSNRKVQVAIFFVQSFFMVASVSRLFLAS